MSDAPTPPGPGWWLASDGNWYPPDQTPGWGPPQPPPQQAPSSYQPYANVPPPVYGATPHPYGYGYVQPTGANNGFALASVIASCASILTCGFGSIVGIICGHIALSQIKRTNENGRNLAVIGLALGYIGIIVGVAYLVFVFAAADGTTEFRFESMVRS